MAKPKDQIEAPEKKQLKLATQTPAQRRALMGELLVQAQLKQIERERHLGEAKVVKNEIDELLEQAKRIARETVTGQLKLAVEEVFTGADEDDENGSEGRFMDQSKVKTPEELRRKPHSEASVSEEDDDSDTDEEEEE